jgi:GNAT superfamily N-acetyltransferase
VTLPPDLVERELEPQEGAALNALVAACDESYRSWAPAGWQPPELHSDWAARFSEPGRWSRVAVEPDGRLVAFVSFRQAHDDPDPGAPAGPALPGVAHVGAVFTHPARWREGIAASMLRPAEVAMVAVGYRSARLWTPEGAPAETFYRAEGWERDGRRAWHHWVGLTVVGYSKPLR